MWTLKIDNREHKLIDLFTKVNANFTEVYNNLNTIEVEQDFDGGAAATVYDNETIFDGGGA